MRPEDIEIEEVDFEALLEESFKKSESKSDLVKGTIVSIDEKEDVAFVDIGGSREASMPLADIRNEAGELIYKTGDEIDVVNMGRGRVSHKAAIKRAALNEFIKEYDPEQEYIIEGEIVKKNKGGFIVDVDGLELDSKVNGDPV